MLMPFRRNDLADSMWERDFIRDFFTNDWLTPMNLDFRTDIKETDQEYIVEAEMPGVNKEQITVEFKDQTLTISAQHLSETNEENQNYIRRERRSGSMSRSFYVENVDADTIKASYTDGILKVILPKAAPSRPHDYRVKID